MCHIWDTQRAGRLLFEKAKGRQNAKGRRMTLNYQLKYGIRKPRAKIGGQL